MNWLTPLVVTIALFGSALVGGVFFAFSSFVMKALARISLPEGIAAMQSINVAVINRSFLGVFMGTALLSVVVFVLVLLNPAQPSMMFLMGGAFFYFVGTFLVTIFGNVPLNNQLATVRARNLDPIVFWMHYLKRYTETQE